MPNIPLLPRSSPESPAWSRPTRRIRHLGEQGAEFAVAADDLGGIAGVRRSAVGTEVIRRAGNERAGGNRERSERNVRSSGAGGGSAAPAATAAVKRKTLVCCRATTQVLCSTAVRLIDDEFVIIWSRNAELDDLLEIDRDGCHLFSPR